MFSHLKPLRFDKSKKGDSRLETPGAGFSSAEAARLLDPDKDLLSVPDTLTLPSRLSPDPARFDQNIPPELRKASPYGLLSSTEVKQLTPKAVVELVDNYNRSAPSDVHLVAAKLGAPASNWYDRSKQLLSIFGSEAPRFSLLLAASSPRTSPTLNLRVAISTWLRYQELIAERESLGKSSLPTYQEIRQHLEERSGEKRAPMRTLHNGVARALSHPTPEDNSDYGRLTSPDGKINPKTDSFGQNLSGAHWPVTVDMWQAVLGDFSPKVLSRLGGPYLAQVIKTRLATAKYNSQISRAQRLTPAQVQGATWSAVRTLSYLAVKLGLTKKFDKRSAVDTAIKLMSPADMGAAKDYLKAVVTDPECTALLHKLGLGKSLDFLRKAVAQNNLSTRPVLADTSLAKAEQQPLQAVKDAAVRGLSSWGGPQLAQFAKGGMPSTLQLAALFTNANRQASTVKGVSPPRFATMVKIGLQAMLQVLGKKKLRYAAGESSSLSLETPSQQPPMPQTPLPETSSAPVPSEQASAARQALLAYSPNTDDLSFDQALARLRSANHKEFRKIIKHVNEQVGVKGKIEDAVGDWSDGAENSFLQLFHEPLDKDTLDYLAAWYGLLANQKSVLRFAPGVNGPDSVYEIEAPTTDLGMLRKSLTAAGIPFRTLVPTKKGTRVVIFDSGRENRAAVAKWAGDIHATVRESHGEGRFVGSTARQSSRTDARARYRDIITAYEAGAATRRGGIRAYKPPVELDNIRAAGGKGKEEASSPARLRRRFSPLRFAVHAPPGGVIIRGVFYKGGKFIPSAVIEKASFPQYQEVERRRGVVRDMRGTQKGMRADGSYSLDEARGVHKVREAAGGVG